MSSVDSIVARLTALHPKRIDLSLDRLQRLLAGGPHHALGLFPRFAREAQERAPRCGEPQHDDGRADGAAGDGVERRAAGFDERIDRRGEKARRGVAGVIRNLQLGIQNSQRIHDS